MTTSNLSSSDQPSPAIDPVLSHYPSISPSKVYGGIGGCLQAIDESASRRSCRYQLMIWRLGLHGMNRSCPHLGRWLFRSGQNTQPRPGVPTYSATIWCSSDDIVLELKIRVEDRGVELILAVEAVAYSFPIRSWLRHGIRSVQCCAVAMLQCARDCRSEEWTFESWERLTSESSPCTLPRSMMYMLLIRFRSPPSSAQ